MISLHAPRRAEEIRSSRASVIHRKRAVFHQALGFGVEAGLLPDNRLRTIQWTAPERVEEELDPECVPDPQLAETLLDAVAEQGPRGRH